jgi:hypothetical protein
MSRLCQWPEMPLVVGTCTVLMESWQAQAALA